MLVSCPNGARSRRAPTERGRRAGERGDFTRVGCGENSRKNTSTPKKTAAPFFVMIDCFCFGLFCCGSRAFRHAAAALQSAVAGEHAPVVLGVSLRTPTIPKQRSVAELRVQEVHPTFPATGATSKAREDPPGPVKSPRRGTVTRPMNYVLFFQFLKFHTF